MKFSKRNYFRNLKKERWAQMNEGVEEDTALAAQAVDTMIASTPFRDSGIQFEPVETEEDSDLKAADIQYAKSLVSEMKDKMDEILDLMEELDEESGGELGGVQFDNFFDAHAVVTNLMYAQSNVKGILDSLRASIDIKNNVVSDEVVASNVDTAVDSWYANAPAQQQEYPNAAEIVASAPGRINALVNGVEYVPDEVCASNVVDDCVNNWVCM